MPVNARAFVRDLVVDLDFDVVSPVGLEFGFVRHDDLRCRMDKALPLQLGQGIGCSLAHSPSQRHREHNVPLPLSSRSNE